MSWILILGLVILASFLAACVLCEWLTRRHFSPPHPKGGRPR
jgi:hypothetical protein